MRPEIQNTLTNLQHKVERSKKTAEAHITVFLMYLFILHFLKTELLDKHGTEVRAALKEKAIPAAKRALKEKARAKLAPVMQTSTNILGAVTAPVLYAYLTGKIIEQKLLSRFVPKILNSPKLDSPDKNTFPDPPAESFESAHHN